MAEPAVASTVAEPTLTPGAAPVSRPTPTAEARPTAPRLSEQLVSARAERSLTRAQERRYERVVAKVKTEEARREAAGQKVEAIELILAIFLPPIGVLVHEKGQLTTKFWISLLLTFLFFIPGMIYALLVVTDTI